ncbi:HEAT repeat domain-containing protein [Rhodococcus sp. BGS-1C]
MTDAAETLVAASRSSDWAVRERASIDMGALLPDPRILHRLIELLQDPNLAVQPTAAEALITRRGRSGLIAVLRDLGDRRDDPTPITSRTYFKSCKDCATCQFSKNPEKPSPTAQTRPRETFSLNSNSSSVTTLDSFLSVRPARMSACHISTRDSRPQRRVCNGANSAVTT